MFTRSLPVMAFVSGVLLTVVATTTDSADRQVVASVAEQQMNVAHEAMRTINKLQKAPAPVTSEQIYSWSHRLMQAELAVGGNDADRTDAIKKHLERMKTIEKRAEQGYRQGEIGYFELLEARWHRVEAEALLSKPKPK